MKHAGSTPQRRGVEEYARVTSLARGRALADSTRPAAQIPRCKITARKSREVGCRSWVPAFRRVISTIDINVTSTASIVCVCNPCVIHFYTALVR